MKNSYTKEEMFEGMFIGLTRINPQIVTEIKKGNNKALFEAQLDRCKKPFLILDKVETPLKLFNFFMENQKALIIVTFDIFNLRKNYLDIFEGAISSSPDSGEPWPIRYLNYPEFKFKGEIILLTNKTREEIESEKRFEYFSRDCYFI